MPRIAGHFFWKIEDGRFLILKSSFLIPIHYFRFMSAFLIIGLGNPGTEYAHTRHNIGFEVVDAFAFRHGGFFMSDRLADTCKLKFKGRQIMLIKPMTFMNLSGRAVKYWIDKEKVPLENTLTVLDDLALPLSKLRLRPAGTHAGHNGLKSIQEILLTDAYPKLRFGIGNDYPRGRQADFVLSKWKKEEIPVVNQKIQASVDIIESFITIGMERTMSEYNKIEFEV